MDDRQSGPEPPLLPIQGRWSEEDRDLVDRFVATHFGFRGTLRLHRNAIGWDLLRAPANVPLAPVYLLLRLAALLLKLTGIRRAARWLAGRRIFFRSAIARSVGGAVIDELVRPRLRDGTDPSPRQLRLVDDYTDIRNAIAEICTTLLVVSVSYALFRTVTPGVISLAPVVSDYAAHARAVAEFPLGDRLGRAWYWMFPVDLPVWMVIAAGAGLAMAASVVTTFAGVIADPLQALFGLHQRRLMRLLGRIDAAGEEPGGIARAHLVARVADLTDAGIGLFRFFRP